MAKMFVSEKWKKRLAIGLSMTLAATLSLGVLSACKTDETATPEEEDAAAMPADSQLLKNGNFEFYSEMTKEEADLRAILNAPSSWSFSSGSPSSDTKSGLVDLNYWQSITSSKYEYASVADAYAKWNEGSIYDKLKFFDKCSTSGNTAFYDAYSALASTSDEKKFFDKNAFSSVDFEDVEYLNKELGASPALHGDSEAKKQEERGVLMIHNRRTSDDAVGTAQSYSSSTTITLKAGTSAKISVWVKTAQLRHYYADSKEEGATSDGLKVTSNAGAYIGVTQTVGGTTLDQMQIKNINTEVTNGGANPSDNGWEQYTLFVRASTFATTTVKLVLGLGQGNSDDRYEAVNGYALFDDVECTVIENGAYADELKKLKAYDESAGKLSDEYYCSVDSKKEEKLFDATKLAENDDYEKTFAIDLYTGFETVALNGSDYALSYALTEEKAGNSIYTSARIDSSLNDNRGDGATASVVGVKTIGEINATTNGYLKNIATKDFAKFPFENENVLLLLSSNGAAYTAKMGKSSSTATSNLFVLEPDTQVLLSFFVKTSAVITGRTGATITLVDGENKTKIDAFDSTTVETVDINDAKKNIYDGWVQCFFFVQNDTKTSKEFSLEFSLGPTSIASSNKYAFAQGYAAFANFEEKTLTKTEYSYASTGTRAKKVNLTSFVEDTTTFDTPIAASDIKNGLGTPLNFKGVVAGSKMVVAGGTENTLPEGIKAGLLNYKNVANYGDVFGSLLPNLTEEGWKELFGDKNNPANTALQPLVVLNASGEAKPSYGYFAMNETTISASTYQKISLRVKLSAGATATVYLTDTSERGASGGYDRFLALNAPKVTYWYDDNGNILTKDPSSKGFNKNTDTAFELQTNGLYRKVADRNDTSYYANLKNYKEKDGNLVTNGGTVAFYGWDGKYYAYRTENADGTYAYSQIVKDLYDNGGKEIARYDYTNATMPESVVKVTNPSTTEATDWVTVTFYVHTGNAEKKYRLEVWAGDRENKQNGIPANGYVFFDRYTFTTVSNYDTLLKDAVFDLEDDDGVTLDQNGNLPKEYAYYYAYTFYDSADYLRYDVNEDKDGVGNLYASYTQSTRSEELISLVYNDENGARTGTPSYIRFFNYAASDVTVTPDSPATDTNTDDDTDKNPISTGDILTIVSSALLGVVLLLVIALMIVRRFTAKRNKASIKKNASVADRRFKPTAKKATNENADAEEENPFVKNRNEKEAAQKAEEKEAEENSVEEPLDETPAEEAPAEENSSEATSEEAPAENDDAKE